MLLRLLPLLFLCGCLVPGSTDSVPSTSSDPKLQALDETLLSVYDVISGPAGERDWDRMRALFHPEAARLMSVTPRPTGGTVLVVMTPDDYIERSGAYFASNAFYETELARRVEHYGHIAHVWSTYESRTDPADEPFARGINTFQLMWDGERWWVCSILWDQESPETPIPQRYEG